MGDGSVQAAQPDQQEVFVIKSVDTAQPTKQPPATQSGGRHVGKMATEMNNKICTFNFLSTVEDITDRFICRPRDFKFFKAIFHQQK